jgi:hypothetical protein
MSEPQLLAAYRNILIQFARHYVTMLELAKNIKAEARNETEGGRISGLFCHARVINRRAAMLKDLLLEDSASLRQFFKTTNLHEIAKQSVTLES